jgi:hypothetical protein
MEIDSTVTTSRAGGFRVYCTSWKELNHICPQDSYRVCRTLGGGGGRGLPMHDELGRISLLKPSPYVLSPQLPVVGTGHLGA